MKWILICEWYSFIHQIKNEWIMICEWYNFIHLIIFKFNFILLWMAVHVAIKMSSSSPNSVCCSAPNAFQSPRLPIMYGDTSLFAGELLQTIIVYTREHLNDLFMYILLLQTIKCTHASTLGFTFYSELYLQIFLQFKIIVL